MSATTSSYNRTSLQKSHIDATLFTALIALTIVGLFILYSASDQNMHVIDQQIVRLTIAFVALIICAQIPPYKYLKWAPWIFCIGILLLLIVLVVGHISKGAQRWLNLGIINFQPSEVMKIAVPMMLAWYLNDKVMPPRTAILLICVFLLLIPVLLTIKEPDLGTAIIIAAAGCSVLLLAGASWWWVIGALILLGVSGPVLWHFLHDYQQQRILTFLNPERNPLGSGYHIIQSKIAIGSGGIFGKGWLQASQSHLQFLPEHSTDFIFAVLAQEFGLFGCLTLLALMLIITGRSLYISCKAQDTFTRLLGGGISITFFFSFFINMGMVSGILPVAGIPLPLVSYGGTSMVTLFAGFGIFFFFFTYL